MFSETRVASRCRGGKPSRSTPGRSPGAWLRAVALPAVAGVFLLPTGCQQPARSVLLPEQVPYVAPSLAAEGVIEVAILPVTRSHGIPDAAISPMRAAAYRELLSKGYSVLSNEFVDQRLGGIDLGAVPAGVGEVGATGPVAEVPIGLLQSRLHADSILSLRAIRVDIEEGGRRRTSVRVALLDGESGEVLFEHTRQGLVEQGLVEDRDLTVDDLVVLVVRALTPLPAR